MTFDSILSQISGAFIDRSFVHDLFVVSIDRFCRILADFYVFVDFDVAFSDILTHVD